MLLEKVFAKFLKYSLVGCISTIIYFVFVYVCIEGVHMDPVLGSAVSFIIMTIVSFFLNVKYTFNSFITKQRAIRFLTVSVIGFVLNLLLMFIVVHVFAYHYFIGELVTILVIPTINFILNNYWTFQTNT